ncbi:hypothetical protein GQ600_23841 [Phytophthora cactorum]|nr:hypothetical protein GQ600_23841 [Phytophthora cactorum]
MTPGGPLLPSMVLSTLATINGPYRVGNSDGDTCSYHAVQEGESCRKPRTCYECLNSDVAGVSDGCLLAPSGFCEDMSSYDSTLDYRRNITGEDLSLTGWYNYFPSVNSTYCEPTDEACVLCDELVNNGSLSQASHWGFKTENVSTEVERQLCIGTDGCVCVMACETDNWEANMPAECDANGSAKHHELQHLVDILFGVASGTTRGFMYKRGLCRRTAPRPRPEGPYNNVNAISSPSNDCGFRAGRKCKIPPVYVIARVEGATIQAEGCNTQAQPLSPQVSARNSDTARAAYTQVQDESGTATSSSRERNNSGKQLVWIATSWSSKGPMRRGQPVPVSRGLSASRPPSQCSKLGGMPSSRTNSDLDTCAYYGLEPGERCFTHRSCYDCLNVPVATDPEGCVLSQFGYCMSMVFYDYTLDYRVTTGPNADSGSPYNFSGGLYHQYPAANTTYCEATDPACVECNAIALNYSRHDNFLARSTKFCLGESGCVCVLSCEPTNRVLCDDLDSSSVADANSDSSTSWTAYTTSPSIIVNRTSNSLTNLYWLLGVPVFIVLLVAHYFIRLKFIEFRRRRLLRMPRRSPRNRLRLSAWRALHEDLIDKEKEPVDSVAFRIEPIACVQEDRVHSRLQHE